MAAFGWRVSSSCHCITLIGVKPIQQEHCSDEGHTSHGGALSLPLAQYAGEMWHWSRVRDWSGFMPVWSTLLCTCRRSASSRKKILTASYECSSIKVKVVQKRFIKNMTDFCQGGIKILLSSDSTFKCELKINVGTSKWDTVILGFYSQKGLRVLKDAQNEILGGARIFCYSLDIQDFNF